MTSTHPTPAVPAQGLGLVTRRCVQFVLDRLIVVVPALVLGYVVAELFAPRQNPHALVIFLITLVIVLFVVIIAAQWLLETWWPLRHGGQTVAMRWLGLRIVTLHGTQPPLRAYVIRLLLMVVDGFLWGIVGLAVMIATPQRQRVGDLVAGTLVVRAA